MTDHPEPTNFVGRLAFRTAIAELVTRWQADHHTTVDLRDHTPHDTRTNAAV